MYLVTKQLRRASQSQATGCRTDFAGLLGLPGSARLGTAFQVAAGSRIRNSSLATAIGFYFLSALRANRSSSRMQLERGRGIYGTRITNRSAVDRPQRRSADLYLQ